MMIAGLDVGSTTVKAAVERDGKVVWQDYKRLDIGDSELLQIGNFLYHPGECTWIGNIRRRVAGKSTNMQFIDDGVFQ